MVWSPHLKQDIEAVESVQIRFTRRLPGFKKFSYAERFKVLNDLTFPALNFVDCIVNCCGVIKLCLVMLI